jgi:hypothetical protein
MLEPRELSLKILRLPIYTKIANLFVELLDCFLAAVVRVAIAASNELEELHIVCSHPADHQYCELTSALGLR